jgi:hypothetical protein
MKKLILSIFTVADQPLDHRVTRRPIVGDSQFRAWCNISIRLA